MTPLTSPYVSLLYGHVADTELVWRTVNWTQLAYPDGYVPPAGHVGVVGYVCAIDCAARRSWSMVRSASRAPDSVCALADARFTTVLVLSRKFSIMKPTI